MRQPADPVTLASPPDAPAAGTSAAALQAATAQEGRQQRLFADLARRPWAYDYFHALRLVEASHPHLPRLGLARRPVDEPLRLGQATELSFAPAALHAFTPADRQGQPRLEVRFFGLFGPNGPLPLHLTAYARERKQLKDATLARFADLFHHRFLLLFYRAWAQAQPAVSLDRPGEDRFADFVGALAGVGGPEWRGREAVSDHVPLAFAGLLSHPVRSAEGLERLLGHYLKRPVRVEQFVGRWMPLPREVRSRLGGGHGGRASSAQLGRSVVLGGAVYDRQHHIRLHLGALDRQAFEALLPGGAAQAAIAAMVRHYLGLEFEWDLQLEVELAERPAIQLGRGPRAGRLGWTSWMGQSPQARRPMLRLSPRATHAAV